MGFVDAFKFIFAVQYKFYDPKVQFIRQLLKHGVNGRDFYYG